jgi:hypothetical protein
MESDEHRVVLRPTEEQKARFVAGVEEVGSDRNRVGVAVLDWWARQDIMVKLIVIGVANDDPEAVALAVGRVRGKKGRKRRG